MIDARTRLGHGSSSVGMTRQTEVLSVTIPSGQAQSNAIDLIGNVLVALAMPAAWTAAALSFLGAPTFDGTYLPVYDDAGTEVIVAQASVVAGRVIVNSTVLEKLASLRFIKLRSGGVGAEVTQGADRVLTLLVKG